jgi:hypothetical protein
MRERENDNPPVFDGAPLFDGLEYPAPDLPNGTVGVTREQLIEKLRAVRDALRRTGGAE